MTHKVFTVTPETPLSVAAAEMLSRRINCLPVVGSDGKVCVIITSTDLLRSYQKIQASLENNSVGTSAGSAILRMSLFSLTLSLEEASV